jgi:hypothetical protein
LGTDDVAQQRELRRAYLNYIGTIFNNNMADIFVNEVNLPHLASILDVVVMIAKDPEDNPNQKLAMNLLAKSVGAWCKQDGIAGFDRYAVQSILNVPFGFFRSGLNFNDAQTQSVLGEAFGLQKALHAALGPVFVDQVKMTVFPEYNLSSESATRYLDGFVLATDAKSYRKFLAAFR